MEDIFIKILNMSITASYFVVALVILRAVFRKIPRWLSCALWGLVGLRLILPFSFESILSLVPSSETIPAGIIYESSPHITSGIGIVDAAAEHILYRTAAPNPSESANPLQIITIIAAAVWLSGIAAMLIYTAVSYILRKRKTAESIKAENGTYLCDGIGSPFILGVIKPKIFIPSNTPEADTPLIISHEKAHIKRLDHLWKPLGFLILSVYWFNPLMWIAYILLCRDIEAACDEKVLKNKGADIKKGYSEALINCSSQRRLITACPLAFGETDVKSRIKNILSYKKPTLWIVISALVISIVLSVCFMTNPDGMKLNDITGYESIFSDVEKIQIFIGNGHIYTTEDTKPELSDIKKVRIDTNPVEKSFTPDFRIKIDDEITINIDESFSVLYLHKYTDGIMQQSSTYSIKNPEVLKNLFSISNYVTGMEGIYVSVETIEETEIGLNFNVIWHNERDIDVEYGEMYYLERFTEAGYYENVPFPENFVFLLPAYLLKSGTTAEKTYFCPMKLSDGEYRFTTTFNTADGKSYEAKTVFFIGEGTIKDNEKRLLTLDDVITLSEKGKELTWSDFEGFSYIETGSGLYIRAYKIDERFSLTIGGTDTDTQPIYIYLNTYYDKIDIRMDDVNAFIEQNKDTPVPLPQMSFANRQFPVDSSGENLNEIISYGSYLPMAYNKWKTYPTVRIDSYESFERFYKHFEDILDYSLMFEDTAFPFEQSVSMYGKDYNPGFFEEQSLLMIYIPAKNNLDRFEVLRLQKSDDKLYINIRENTYADTESSTPTGWLLAVEVYTSDLASITGIEAYVGETLNLPEPEITHYYSFISDRGFWGRSFYLYDDGTFTLDVHPYSSHIEYGNVEYQGDLMILTTDDNERRYVFEVNIDYVTFKRNESVVHSFFTEEEVPDGAKFMLQ